MLARLAMDEPALERTFAAGAVTGAIRDRMPVDLRRAGSGGRHRLGDRAPGGPRARARPEPRLGSRRRDARARGPPGSRAASSGSPRSTRRRSSATRTSSACGRASRTSRATFPDVEPRAARALRRAVRDTEEDEDVADRRRVPAARGLRLGGREHRQPARAAGRRPDLGRRRRRPAEAPMRRLTIVPRRRRLRPRRSQRDPSDDRTRADIPRRPPPGGGGRRRSSVVLSQHDTPHRLPRRAHGRDHPRRRPRRRRVSRHHGADPNGRLQPERLRGSPTRPRPTPTSTASTRAPPASMPRVGRSPPPSTTAPSPSVGSASTSSRSSTRPGSRRKSTSRRRPQVPRPRHDHHVVGRHLRPPLRPGIGHRARQDQADATAEPARRHAPERLRLLVHAVAAAPAPSRPARVGPCRSRCAATTADRRTAGAAGGESGGGPSVPRRPRRPAAPRGRQGARRASRGTPGRARASSTVSACGSPYAARGRRTRASST